MAVEQLKNLIGVIRKDPSRAPDGQYDQVSEGKTSVVADMYNLDFKDKRALAEVCHTKKTYASSPARSMECFGLRPSILDVVQSNVNIELAFL